MFQTHCDDVQKYLIRCSNCIFNVMLNFLWCPKTCILKCCLLGRPLGRTWTSILLCIFWKHQFIFILGYPPSVVQKCSVIISEHSGLSVDSSVKLMVESSSSGGRGAEEGRPPPRISDATDRQENIIQGMFSHSGTSQTEKSQSQRSQDHEVPESCDKVQHQTSTQPCGTKLPNGHASLNAHEGTERDFPKSTNPTGSYLNSTEDHMMANGELSADSKGGAVSSTSLINQSHSEITLPPQHGAEDRCSNTQDSVIKSTHGDEGELCSSDSPSSPKHSLRTFSSSSFFNTDSAPLSPDDDETFSTSDTPDDLRFMDVSLNSRNTYEISRRQSAPDNIPGVLSVAAADLTLSQKKHGISEIFSRYCHALQFCFI